MSARPWYKRYPSDFVSGTIMLSAEEKGVYAVLLDLMYDRGEPIPDDAQWLGRVCGCTTRRFNQVKARLLDEGKIVVRDGVISNNRFEKQVEKEKKEHEIFVENGAKGGEKTAEKRTEINENNVLVENGLLFSGQHIPEARSQKPEKKDIRPKPKKVSYPDDFEAFWKAYPTDPNMAKVEALKPWLALTDEDRLAARAAIPGFRDYCAKNPTYRPVHACRFLSQRRFDGFAPQSSNVTPLTRDPATFTLDDWTVRIRMAQDDPSKWLAIWGDPPPRGTAPEILVSRYLDLHRRKVPA